jgi:hypothetical protein
MLDNSGASRRVTSRKSENIWHVACPEESMRRNTDIRSYAIASTEDQEKRADSAGQSGDTQGLSDVAEAGSESVAELVEAGQYVEGDAIAGVEDASDPDVAEVHTKQVPEDDVPSEYLDRD